MNIGDYIMITGHVCEVPSVRRLGVKSVKRMVKVRNGGDIWILNYLYYVDNFFYLRVC